MDYRATLNLPKTKFKMKANLAQKEPELLKVWEKEGLYQQVQKMTEGRPVFLLHDGPPYANGFIHLGTAFNKVLKDIILRSKRMSGFHCVYIPGWDCHGLPIEHNVDKELGSKKKEISTLAFRGACRKYAKKWIDKQRADFKRLGVLGDWENPYLTINYDYEATIAREFNSFLLNGSVTRSKKPVYWCSSCTTALAEAEVEYEDHSSPSIYVKFPVESDLSEVVPELAGKNVSAVIWTTTPWTLPANLAVAMHPAFTYAAVETGEDVFLMAEGLVEKACSDCGITDYKIIATFSAGSLEGKKCKHPFLERESLIVLADYVTLESGTGCVHTAPGHGREDYLTGIRYGLPVLSPVDNHGAFTDEAGPYVGMNIMEANPLICDDLRKGGFLLEKKELSHSYPHCWRCKKPVIFRATEQWFIGMENNDLREKALAAIKKVNWTPSWGMERIYGMVENRPDWCLSRQRAWGVPITAIMCEKCGEIMNDEEINERIDALFRKEGADAWFSHELEDFLGADKVCPKCGSTDFFKENDILDVWFDSGVSYAAVLEGRGLTTPADLYLEGSDQHRGWFQSSLLASVGTRGEAPYKGVLTHGFVVDGQGRKMSKSVGNVIAPGEIIKDYGADILRLWVSSEDYRDDIKISDEILRRLSDAYRKIRNTIRYMLGNLSDFSPAQDSIALQDMPELDRWALSRFEVLKRKVMKAYEDFEFHTVYHTVYQFCTVTMSSLYLDILKDRLYTELADSLERRAAQTVLYEILDGLIRLMSPVLSFTAPEVWKNLPDAPGREESVFMASFPALKDENLDEELNQVWERLGDVRAEITKVLEKARQEKVIGHSLEAEVWICATGELADFMADKWGTLETITIVSKLHRTESPEDGAVTGEVLPELSVLVKSASSEKCERCWLRSETVGQNPDHPTICSRCSSVVAKLGAQED
ncbi:MAG: isoleucine--tRNA ligase [Desulfobulbaceae bacterium]|nr:isoleucine--tRNA ligase [Desulfobulbaceae bacterium]